MGEFNIIKNFFVDNVLYDGILSLFSERFYMIFLQKTPDCD
jgi:hypothetical protein